MVEVTVSRITIDPDTKNPIVFLREKHGRRLLPIYIGHTEAHAIAMEMAGMKFPRPLTHDLLRQVIVGLEAQLHQVRITSVRNNTFYAELHIRREDHVVHVDARPSDSIAVALRLQAPIFAAEDLLEAASEHAPEEPDDELDDAADTLESDKLKQHLQGLNPEDFGKFIP